MFVCNKQETGIAEFKRIQLDCLLCLLGMSGREIAHHPDNACRIRGSSCRAFVRD